MEEEQVLSPVAVTHLLQQTLRSLCLHDNSQWVYAVFWRILPRNFPPPKWDSHGGAYDRSRGNRRNWILVWEDGFCNFAASTNAEINSSGDHHYSCSSSSAYAAPADQLQQFQGGLQPELFFKMSHEIYNYGEGFIGKVAADRSHKWIYKEAATNEQEINFLSSWHNSADLYPRTWEAQFQSGIKTIALVAVREGVVQLGAVNKVIEDLSYVVLLRKKLSLIESIPGVLLPHPSSSAFPYKAADHLFAAGYGDGGAATAPPAADQMWHYHQGPPIATSAPPLERSYHHHDHHHQMNYNNNNNNNMMKIAPSMSSLEALLSKLPSVVPSHDHQRVPVPPLCSTGGVYDHPHLIMLTSNYNRPPPPPPNLGLQADQKVQKQEINYEDHQDQEHHNHEDQNQEEEEEQVVRTW